MPRRCAWSKLIRMLSEHGDVKVLIHCRALFGTSMLLENMRRETQEA